MRVGVTSNKTEFKEKERKMKLAQGHLVAIGCDCMLFYDNKTKP